jgi:hypothetical protein
VLSKLPLVRFSQPVDPSRVRYWYDLLSSIHVTFAVCSANGRVLAAIDLDTDRGNSRRVLQIKQSVLGACRVRYLRCPVENLPSVAELQLLVPQAGANARGPQAAAAPIQNLHQARWRTPWRTVAPSARHFGRTRRCSRTRSSRPIRAPTDRGRASSAAWAVPVHRVRALAHSTADRAA